MLWSRGKIRQILSAECSSTNRCGNSVLTPHMNAQLACRAAQTYPSSVAHFLPGQWEAGGCAHCLLWGCLGHSSGLEESRHMGISSVSLRLSRVMVPPGLVLSWKYGSQPRCPSHQAGLHVGKVEQRLLCLTKRGSHCDS